MLPWMCGRQTLTIVVSSPCITQAQMIVAVVKPRLAAGGALSPLTPPAFAVGSSSARNLERKYTSGPARLSHGGNPPAAVPRATAAWYNRGPADEEVPA